MLPLYFPLVQRDSLISHQIILENICKSYKDKQQNKTTIFEKFNAIFSQAKSYAIVGKSGCGKSTLLNILAGFDTNWTGKITYSSNASDTTKTLDNPTRPKFGFIFQNNYLIDQLTCLENVALAPMAHNLPKQEAIAKSMALLKQLDVSSKANSYPKELSGGQQARVCIARALAIEPDFLIADEPTANLDFQTSSKVIEALLTLKTKLNKGLIISTHDPELAQKLEVVIKM